MPISPSFLAFDLSRQARFLGLLTSLKEPKES